MRLIDADALAEEIEKDMKNGFPANENLSLYAISCIAHAPTVCDIEQISAERQMGEWEEERDERHGISRFTCSQCGNVIQDVENRITFFTFNRYCGRCGSKNA